MKTAIIVLCAAVAVWANEPQDMPSTTPREIETETPDDGSPGGWGMGRIAMAARQISKLGDWEDQIPNIEKSLDRLWDENDWNEESDQFALEAVRGVAQIPPWEIARRVEFMTGEFGARYGMNKSQIRDLQSRTYQMIGSLAVRHGGTVFKHVSEMVDGLQGGEPVTPEDVSRWMVEGEGMIEFAHQQVESISKHIAADLDREHREVFMRDLASYRKRMERFDDMRERWEAGGWHPGEWGLEEVPIYKRMMAERVRDGRYDEDKWRRFDELQKARREYERKSKETRYDESAWERYVREFIAMYYLDDAQAETAWSILREQRQRAGDVRRLEQRRMVQTRFGRTAIFIPLSDEALERIRDLFDELCTRLDRIPTDAQRYAAETLLPMPAQSPLQALPANARAEPASIHDDP